MTSERRAPIRGTTPLGEPRLEPVWSAIHPPLPGGERVPLHDFAYTKLTMQSSVVASPCSGWMFSTEPEAEPWWEIDLRATAYVERIALWLSPLPEGTEITVAAHAVHTPRGTPAAGSFRFTALADDLPIASDGSLVLWIAADTVARHVRVSLRGAGGAVVALLLRGVEIMAARLFLESLPETYARAFTLFADRPLFAARATPGEGPFEITHRYREVWTAARGLAAGLAGMLETEGEGDRVFLGLCMKNRAEWVMADMAAVMRGYVVVSLSPEDSDERLAGILGRCPLAAVIVDGSGRERFTRLASHCPSLRLVVRCDEAREAPATEHPRVVAFSDVVARGAANEAAPARPREGGDLFTILFTSGSSGVPKGAMRSYATFLSMLESYGVPQPAVHLSFQPLGHISERMYLPAIVLNGGLVGFSAGGPHVLSDLRALEPSAVGSVPRLYEIVYAAHRRRLAAALAASPDEPKEAVEARVLAESRQAFGARVQGIGVGSAPCSPELLAFLKRCFADVWVADGYGSTEHGTITTAGQIRPGVEVKLVPVADLGEIDGEDEGKGKRERGEIWVRTPHVIDGYYGDPAATAARIDAQGFFRTGDLGERTDDGGVRIVGRVENVIKLGQGEFVAVDRVEAALATSPLVDRIFVHPDASSSSLLAVVVPEPRALASLLGVPARAPHDLAAPSEASPHELAAHPEAARAITRALADHGRRAGLAGFELPRAVLIDPAPMTVASGLITASGKLARPAAVARYASRLAALSEALSEAPSEIAAEGDSLAARIAAAVSAVVGRRVEPDEPIHEGLGADSLVAAEVLSACALVIGRDIPLAAWFEARTVEDLALHLDATPTTERIAAHEAKRSERTWTRHGSRAALDDLLRQDLDLDLPLSPTSAIATTAPRVPFATVLLTGATGLLGAHLLESLLARTSAHVICLVRAPSDEAARDRVRATMARYAIPPPDEARWSAVAADLAAPRLGLDPARLATLAGDADAILHAGAEVDWLAPYTTLRPANVLGTAELTRLARTGKRKPIHFVSTISTAPSNGDETSSLPLDHARMAGGYGLTKWVAEQLVRRAAEHGHPAAVYRPSMITGHSQRGRGNPDDYVHRYLRASIASGLYLDLDAPSDRLDMTPVDYVADGIVALMMAHPDGGATHHLSNIDQSMTYRKLGEAMKSAGVALTPSTYAAFRERAVRPAGSPLRPLSSYFPEDHFAMHMGPWPAARTRAALAALGVNCPPVDQQLVAAYLAGLAETRTR